MTVKTPEIHDAWIKTRIKENEISRYLERGEDFVSEREIFEKLEAGRNPDPRRVKDILAKSLAVQTLEPEETAALIHVGDPELLAQMEETAFRVKRKVYDNRIVTFAPLYTGNLCVNNCLYCGFRADNCQARRRVLGLEEIREETRVLAGKIGHKRLIAVYGEHPETGVDYIVSTIEAIYGVKEKTRRGYGNIRRVNVNAAPMSIEDLKKLYEVGIGTYQVFQETYHRPTYEKLHPKGTLKSHYRWRLYCMHRALEAGIDDVGIGVLFGLYDWKFEMMGLLYHSRDLERRMGIGPHTVSFPRMEPAMNAPYTKSSQYAVNDAALKKIVALIRLSVPHTGMIITAREKADLRRQTVGLGITQMDASTQIGIGSYSGGQLERQEEDNQQFILGDTRSLDELIRELAEMGHITSFCTAGYRCGRTGKCIMDLLRSGTEGKFCKLNAVLTFREWLDDFAAAATREAGEAVIRKEIAEVRDRMPTAYARFMETYERTCRGERDLYF